MTTGEVIALIKAFGGSGGGSGGGGVLVVNVTHDESTGTATCDKTAGEMLAAMEAGGVVLKENDGGTVYYKVVEASLMGGVYQFVVVYPTGAATVGTAGYILYLANSASDYPSFAAPSNP